MVTMAWVLFGLVASAVAETMEGPQLPKDLHQAAATLFAHHDPAYGDVLMRRLGLLDSNQTQRTTDMCNPKIIGSAGGPQRGQTACSNYVWNTSAGKVEPGGSMGSNWQADCNIDPIYGSYFPWQHVIPAPTSEQLLPPLVQKDVPGYVTPHIYAVHEGLALAPQVGWGGGPNVTLGPPSTKTVWGVHSTPLTNPQLAQGQASVLFSFLIGGANYNVSVNGRGYGSGGKGGQGGYTLVCRAGLNNCSLGTLTDTPAPGAFIPKGVNFTATVMMGTSKDELLPVLVTSLTCLQYLRVIEDTNYLSPYTCHATVPNLHYRTTYYYTISVTVSGAPPVGDTNGTYTTPSATFASTESTYKLITPSPPSTGCPTEGSCTSVYPMNLALMADVGQTYNSSLTAQYMATYISKNAVQAVIFPGDYTYGDDFGAYSTYAQFASGPGVNPMKWDSWSVMWQSVMGQAMLVGASGNHEIESVSGGGGRYYTDNSTTYNFLSPDQKYPFQAWGARFPNGAQSTSSYGDLWVNSYYSQNLGPVHVITLNSYLPFFEGTEQYNWFLSDIQAVNREAQPWLIVQYHVPMYHSFITHYKEAECMRSIYEPLFYQYGVDFVINGHVHGYERTHAVYNYTPDPCGPVHIVVGDGGNVEGPYRDFVDDFIPDSPNVPYCQAAAGGTIKPGVSPNNSWAPDYQRAAQPPWCPTLSFQPAQNGTTAGTILNPLDPASNTYWCQSAQPLWSAYRAPSFGFAGLTLLSDNKASYTWYRNIDQRPDTDTLTATDTAIYTRYTGQCPRGPAPVTTATTTPAPSSSFPWAPVLGTTGGLAVAAAAGVAVWRWRKLNVAQQEEGRSLADLQA